MLTGVRVSFFFVLAVGLGVGLMELRTRQRREDKAIPGDLRNRYLQALAESA